jgi:hypothetical protein
MERGMIASIILDGYRRDPMLPPIPGLFSGPAHPVARAPLVQPRSRRRRLPLRRRIWGIVLPPWPKDE